MPQIPAYTVPSIGTALASFLRPKVLMGSEEVFMNESMIRDATGEAIWASGRNVRSELPHPVLGSLGTPGRSASVDLVVLADGCDGWEEAWEFKLLANQTSTAVRIDLLEDTLRLASLRPGIGASQCQRAYQLVVGRIRNWVGVIPVNRAQWWYDNDAVGDAKFMPSLRWSYLWTAAASVGSADSWTRLRGKALGRTSKGYSRTFLEAFRVDAGHTFNLSDSGAGLSGLNRELVGACAREGVTQVRLAEVWWSRVKARQNAYLSLDDFLMCIVRIET